MIKKKGKMTMAKITFPREYLEAGKAWAMFSFHADGSYIVLKGSMEKWRLLEEHKDGSLTYARFNEAELPSDSRKLH